MADAALLAVALEKITSFVEENVRILAGVTDEVEDISRELKRMQMFLRDADSVYDSKHQSVRLRLREIRRLSYQVEDIIEAFAVQFASDNRRGLNKILKRISCIVCEAKSLRNLGIEIAKVKADISTIATGVQRYDVKAIGAGERILVGNENQWLERQTYAHQVEEHFVGMEEDMKKLLSLVLDHDDKYHRVISIWGMGGLGKTTLARKIYKHRDVQCRFQCCAWVCVTQHAQINVILQDVLKQIAPEMKEVYFMGIRELVQRIYQVQKVKKSLIVLDDIWKLEDWKSLVSAFPIAEGDSKILITTRNQKIAEIGFAYALKCLTETESWELLQKIVSSGNNMQDFKIEQEMETVGTQMVRKCGGLPLAISVLGGILKDKNSLTEWQTVSRYVSSYLSNVEDDEDCGAVARVLSLSYDDLPYYLKPCFLYLGSFQEDKEIEFGSLYMLWESEGIGLVQHLRSERSSVAVAERYLEELAQRSMVQLTPHQPKHSWKYYSCSLHDMMRDLCLEKGREEEFSKVIDFRGLRQPLLDPSSSTNPSCRLVINMDSEVQNVCCKRITKVQVKGQQLRSLRCLNLDSKLCGREMIWPQGILSLEDSKSLRVVEFEGYDFQGEKLPVDLRKSVHLRYLKINNCKLDELPSSIAKLPFLHTLYIQVNNAIKVPNVVWKMRKLKHLYLFTNGRYIAGNQRLRLRGLDEVETLLGLDSRTDETSDLTNLLNLQNLSVKVHDNNSLHSIINYINMRGLKLKASSVCINDGCDFIDLNEGYILLRKVLMCDKLHYLALLVKMNKFPKYESGLLQNLFVLNLAENKIEEDPIATLEMLPQLRYLWLGPGSYMGKEMSFHEWGFPQLIALRLLKLSNLESWRVEKGAMPKLDSLVILDCLKLEMIPNGLKFVVKLRELVIYEMPERFCERIGKTDGQRGDDYDKIKHVPSISFNRLPEFESRESTSLAYHTITFLGLVYKSLYTL